MKHGVRFKDLAGLKFKMLTVVSFDGKGPRGQSKWLCRSDCGEMKAVYASNLTKTEGTYSCGCHLSSLLKKRNTKHGLTRTKEYDAWSGAKSRCYCPTSRVYRWYGGRGITMCDRWKDSFASFMEDMGKCPTNCYSLGRIDNSKGYEHGNCRWEDREQQMNNTSRNRRIEYKGKTMTMTQWARHFGVDPITLCSRLHSGKTFEYAISELTNYLSALPSHQD